MKYYSEDLASTQGMIANPIAVPVALFVKFGIVKFSATVNIM